MRRKLLKVKGGVQYERWEVVQGRCRVIVWGEGSGTRDAAGYSVQGGKWCMGAAGVHGVKRKVVQGMWQGTVCKEGSGAREVAGYSVEEGKWCKGGGGV